MNPSDADAFAVDYQALTEACGYCELENWSTVTLTGADRQTFLHNMCTNDIRQLAAGEGCEAFCTNVKGKIVAHVFVLAFEDRLELLTVPEQADALIAHLDRYIIREDVQLNDQTSECCWKLLLGPKANQIVEALAPAAVGKLAGNWQNASAEVDRGTCLVVCCELFWPGGYLLRSSRAEKSVLVERLQASGSRCCGDAALDAVRIESGLPWFASDFAQANLPQEVDRDRLAISFNKGCYLGQETIARIDALGHVNQKVVLVQFDDGSDPTVGLELTAADKVVGKVTSSCCSPQKRAPLALAMVRRGSNAVGSELHSAVSVAKVVAAFSQPDRA